MGMELPTIRCQVVTRTDVSRTISTVCHSDGNVETDLEITEVERSERNVSISVWVKICLRKSAPRNLKARGMPWVQSGDAVGAFAPVECRLCDSLSLINTVIYL